MLPKEFKERMTALLGDEAQRLFDEIENVEAIKAFRVNCIKCNSDMLEAAGAAVDRDDSLWVENAYYTREKFPGSLPEHHSGAIYMQDPSAMATVSAIGDICGKTVLDSCAAPGGKTGQLASKVGECGVVFANEYEPSRARILQSNVERMGCGNVIISNVDTSTYYEDYKDYFDLVLCDAPCSGEGMFRKNERAIEEWSVENVKMCAERQREILSNVVACVKKGGQLLYSTCTFSLEENEMNVAWLLDKYPEFELLDVPEALKRATSDGICLEERPYDMKKTRRFYPHVSKGEGQFIALLGRKNDESCSVGDACPNVCEDTRKPDKKGKKSSKNDQNKNSKLQNKQYVELISLGKAFLQENLAKLPRGELVVLGGKLWLSPTADLLPYGMVTAGVCLGEAQKGRFVPHHQLFSAFGKLFLRRLCLSYNSTLTSAYLFGEELNVGAVEKVELGAADASATCTATNSEVGEAMNSKVGAVEKVELGAADGSATCAAANSEVGEAANSEVGDAYRGDHLLEFLNKDVYVSPEKAQNGWAAVLLGGCATGGVKISGDVAKNHYPKGLRNKRMG